MFNLKIGDVGVITQKVLGSRSFKKINPLTYDKFLLPEGDIVVITVVTPSYTYLGDSLLISEVVQAHQINNRYNWCKLFPEDLEIIKFK